MIHLHVRDAEERHSLDVERYRAAVAAVRREAGPAMICQSRPRRSASTPRPSRSPRWRRCGRRRSRSPCASCSPRRRTRRRAPRILAGQAKAGTLVQHILYDAGDVARFQGLVARRLIPPERASVLFVLGALRGGQQSDPPTCCPSSPPGIRATTSTCRGRSAPSAGARPPAWSPRPPSAATSGSGSRTNTSCARTAAPPRTMPGRSPRSPPSCAASVSGCGARGGAPADGRRGIGPAAGSPTAPRQNVAASCGAASSFPSSQPDRHSGPFSPARRRGPPRLAALLIAASAAQAGQGRFEPVLRARCAYRPLAACTRRVRPGCRSRSSRPPGGVDGPRHEAEGIAGSGPERRPRPRETASRRSCSPRAASAASPHPAPPCTSVRRRTPSDTESGRLLPESVSLAHPAHERRRSAHREAITEGSPEAVDRTSHDEPPRPRDAFRPGTSPMPARPSCCHPQAGPARPSPDLPLRRPAARLPEARVTHSSLIMRRARPIRPAACRSKT